MNTLNLITASLAALGLAACGNPQEVRPAETMTAEAPMEMAGETAPTEMASSDMSGASERIGRATGTIKSVAGQSDFLTIDHGPIDGVGMGAMTMGFDIAGDVDLTGFSEGDTVAFEVKQGRDGSYRIMSICNTGTEGADCLDTEFTRSGNPE